KRPSRFVILSASFGSLSGERSKARAQDDTAASASFDSQRVFFSWNGSFHGSGCPQEHGLFEMDWPSWPPAVPYGERALPPTGGHEGPHSTSAPLPPLREMAPPLPQTYP